MADKLDRIKGCIFGLAIGDALGATLEFMKKEEIKEKYGVLKDIIGGGWLHLKPGEFTDDTQLTLALAHSIIDNQSFVIEDVAKRYLDWMHSDPPDIGNTTREALNNLDKGVSPLHSGMPAPAAGNGSIMRCAPIGLAFNNHELITTYSELDSAITHANPLCTKGSSLINRLINSLVNGQEYKPSIENVMTGSYYNEFAGIVTAHQGIDSPSGYVLDTMTAAFSCLNTTGTFERTLMKVVNLGGDADTTGAVCGAIAGAWYGFSSIPQRWLDKIQGYDELGMVAIGLYKLSEQNITTSK